jgi:RNA polymerase sigma-70 factor (ECF subfamily)
MKSFAETAQTAVLIEPAGNVVTSRPRPIDVGLQVEAAYVAHSATVNRFLLGLTRDPDEAADLTGEVFERAVRAARRGMFDLERPLPWLLLTARRRAVDRWRRAGRLAAAVLRLPVRLTGTTDQERSESLLWLDEVCKALPARQRDALLLRYQADLADVEIGEVMGISESGVRSLVARAVATLRAHEELLR